MAEPRIMSPLIGAALSDLTLEHDRGPEGAGTLERAEGHGCKGALDAGNVEKL